MRRGRWVLCGLGLVGVLGLGLVFGWEYFRSRAPQRPGKTPQTATPVPEPREGMFLQWSRELAPPRPAWPASQPWLRFDESYSPALAEGLLVVPSMVSDSVTAYDATNGLLRWRFYADGPVRFAPIASGGKVYFASDDGCLWCLNAETGTRIWRFRAAPYQRWVLGNGRLISTWPIRGGPVLYENTLYFTAGIWPFMGILAYAVDAERGGEVWCNSGQASEWTVQPHNSPAFGGFVPQGRVAVTSDAVVVAGGRTQPGCYDRKTGRFRRFDFGAKNTGSWQVMAHGDWYLADGRVVRLADGKTLLTTPATLMDDKALYGATKQEVFAQSLVPREATMRSVDRKGKEVETKAFVLDDLWRVPLPEGAPNRVFLKMDSWLILGGSGQAAAVRVDPDRKHATIDWNVSFQGHPWTMLAGDGRLFVVTTEGWIFAFGPTERSPMVHRLFSHETAEPLEDAAATRAARILAQTGVREGYAVLLGLKDASLAAALADQSSLQVIAVASDLGMVDAVRRGMDRRGDYGTRVAILPGDPAGAPLPPYLASLVVVEAPADADPARRARLVQSASRVLRPYGGMAVFPGVAAGELKAIAQGPEFAGIEVKPLEDGSALARAGALPGAADWTHQYADPANTVVSADRLVRAPLGLLWFGGPPNDDVLARHGHGPNPQVAAGRLVIEGADMLRAVDVYTGRLLWQRQLPGLGKFYDNTKHEPGANAIGSNYVSLPDNVYVVHEGNLLVLDAATGNSLGQFPPQPGSDGSPRYWGFLAVSGDRLAATLSRKQYVPAGEELVVMDRHTGKPLWSRPAKYGFRHNAVALAPGRVFLIDSLSPAVLAAERRQGTERPDYRPQLMALDASTGRELWSTGEDVFGTFVNYSAEHDVLLQAGSASKDRPADESQTGMAAYRGADGKVLWKDLKRKHNGPCLLHHDTIIAQTQAYELLTGRPKLRKDPLTGQELPWSFSRNHGCNTAVGSEHLLTFRSAAAGFFDLARDGGTGNLGGFRSGCTSNLIAAGGVLNAPDYTRMCTCRYQNQTSLALVHDPKAEMWTFNAIPWSGSRVRRLGINFGAPGDRVSDQGTLWLEYPPSKSPSPQVPVVVEPPSARYFRHHASRVRVPEGSGGLDWVSASGVEGVERVTITLARQKNPVPPQRYTVRLHLVEPDDVPPGARVFSVRIQDGPAAEIDVAKEAGRMTALVREFRGVNAADKLTLAFKAQGQAEKPGEARTLGPILCGIELTAEP